jgi:hypothetical protein
VQNWLELGKGCCVTPRAKRKIIRIEVEGDQTTHSGALSELQAVAASDTENCQRARLKLSNGSL